MQMIDLLFKVGGIGLVLMLVWEIPLAVWRQRREMHRVEFGCDPALVPASLEASVVSQPAGRLTPAH